MVDAAIEVVAQHQRQHSGVGHVACGNNHKIALSGHVTNIDTALVIERSRENRDFLLTHKGAVLLVKHLSHKGLTVGLQGGGVRQRLQNALIELRFVALDKRQILHHVGIHIAQLVAQLRIGIE